MAESRNTRTLAQDVLRCKFCGGGQVELYCTFCSANLCTKCSSDHLLSDQLNRHEVIAFKHRDTAPTHTNEHVKHVKCPCPLCKDDAPTKQKMEDIGDSLRSKLKRLHKEAEMIKSQKLPEIFRLRKEIENKIDEIKTTYKLRINEVRLQSIPWHVAVHDLVQEYEEGLKTMEENDLSDFEKQKFKYEKLLAKAKRKLEIHESNDITQMENLQFPDMVFPDPILWTGPNFVPINVTKKTIRNFFGTLTSSSVEFHKAHQNPSNFSQRPSTSGYRLQRYRPEHEICRCANRRLVRSFTSGESKCGNCRKFIK